MGLKVAVIGLGLMGASLAGALRGFKKAHVAGMDMDEAAGRKALAAGWVDEYHTDAREVVKGAELVIFCVYARHIPALLQACKSELLPGAVVSDICGVKSGLYKTILPLLPAGVRYIGLHPMAGRERDGIDNADPALYQNTSMLVCPTEKSGEAELQLALALAEHIGCARTQVTGWEKHDEIIAYTSDLMHISAAMLCREPHPNMTLAFTAGAFRDCTRIADINADAWCELLMENRQNVAACLDDYIEGLQRVGRALKEQDEKTLHRLLKQAGDNKRELLRR